MYGISIRAGHHILYNGVIWARNTKPLTVPLRISFTFYSYGGRYLDYECSDGDNGRRQIIWYNK